MVIIEFIRQSYLGASSRIQENMFCFIQRKFTVFFLSLEKLGIFENDGSCPFESICLTVKKTSHWFDFRGILIGLLIEWIGIICGDWGIKIDTNDTQFIVNVDECWTDNNNNLLLRQNGISQKWNEWNDLARCRCFIRYHVLSSIGIVLCNIKMPLKWSKEMGMKQCDSTTKENEKG